MDSQRPSRLRRRLARRRESVRSTFAVVAAVGAAAGLVALWTIDHVGAGDTPGIVQVALLAPAVLFVAWWFAFPGVTLERDLGNPAPAVVDVDARVERIEAAFDALAVPRAHRRGIDAPSETVQATFRQSIRRPDAHEVDAGQFGLARGREHRRAE